MKMKLVLSSLACCLVVSSWIAVAAPESSKRPSIPPVPDGSVAGRFLLETSSTGPDGIRNVFRIDTFTGQTWRFVHDAVEVKLADGKTGVEYIDYWKGCMEEDAAEMLKKQSEPPATK
jgi:hypothetical protein